MNSRVRHPAADASAINPRLADRQAEPIDDLAVTAVDHVVVATAPTTQAHVLGEDPACTAVCRTLRTCRGSGSSMTPTGDVSGGPAPDRRSQRLEFQ